MVMNRAKCWSSALLGLQMVLFWLWTVMEETFASLIHLKFSWKTWSNSYEFLNKRAASEGTLSQLPECCMIFKKIYVHVSVIEQIYTQNGSISCQQSDYLHFLLSVYIKQTFKNSKNSATRFRQPCRSHKDIIHMFWGPLRSFHTKSDAINWHEHIQYLHHFLHHSHSVWHYMCGI